MTIQELNLPARYAAGLHFRTAYSAAHVAADRLERMADDNGRLRDDAGTEQTKETIRLLTEALCAARELDNLLAGNPPPKRGE